MNRAGKLSDIEARAMGGNVSCDSSLGRVRRSGDSWSGKDSLTLETGDVLAEKHGLAISEGLQGTSENSTSIVPLPEIEGAKTLKLKPLKGAGRIYDFPMSAFATVPPEKAFARQGRAALPLSVCRPPHVIVGQARTFATFSNAFIVVPSPQIGIAGKEAQTSLLKGLIQ